MAGSTFLDFMASVIVADTSAVPGLKMSWINTREQVFVEPQKVNYYYPTIVNIVAENANVVANIKVNNVVGGTS